MDDERAEIERRLDEESRSGMRPRPEGFLREPDYGASDYVRLPDFGTGFYSLEDAALLAALDMWSAGKAPGVPADGFPPDDDDDDAHDHQDDPRIRAALEPLRMQILAALVRSAEAGQLEVEVRGRNLADSRLIPGRTFLLLPDLVEWLEVHGHDRGDIIADTEAAEMGDPWAVANRVAAERARFRMGCRDSSRGGRIDRDDIAVLREELYATQLLAAHLRRQIDEAGHGCRPPDVPLSTRKLRTLQVLVAALCRKAGIDPSARGAAASIAGLTHEIGAPVSEQTVRDFLAGIPDAMATRSK